MLVEKMQGLAGDKNESEKPSIPPPPPLQSQNRSIRNSDTASDYVIVPSQTPPKVAPPKPVKPRSLSPNSRLNRTSLMSDDSNYPQTPTTPSRPVSNFMNHPITPMSPSNVMFTPAEESPAPPPPPPPPPSAQMFDDIPPAPLIPTFASDAPNNIGQRAVTDQRKKVAAAGPSARDVMLNSIKGGMVIHAIYEV